MPERETVPTSLSYSAIGEYAERVGQHHQLFVKGDRADVDGLIHQLGGRCVVAEGPESLHVEAPGKFTIFLPTSTSLRRDRFTKAHELGHYFLHYLFAQETGERRFARGSRNTVETEANVFASSLLMPADRFATVWAGLGGDVVSVAHAFDVSPAAAEVRAQVLGLK